MNIMHEIYRRHGQQGVYDYANERGLPWVHCIPCDTDTPNACNECGVCGTFTDKDA